MATRTKQKYRLVRARSGFTLMEMTVVILIIGVLVITLLVGAFLIVNLAMMTRRRRDLPGDTQEPSDVGILENERFASARARDIRPKLPSEEDEDQVLVPSEPPRRWRGEERHILYEKNMPPDFRKSKPKKAA